MKKLINILTTLAILLLNITLIAMAINLPPSNLKNTVMICDTKNLGSWSADQAQPRYFKSITTQDNKIAFEANYINTDKIITFSCKTKISVNNLYEAKQLQVKILTSQKVDFLISLSRNGIGGPSPATYTIKPDKNGEPNIINMNLDSKDRPKINWLTGDYNSVQFRFTNFDTSKELNVKIYDAYIQ